MASSFSSAPIRPWSTPIRSPASSPSASERASSSTDEPGAPPSPAGRSSSASPASSSETEASPPMRGHTTNTRWPFSASSRTRAQARARSRGWSVPTTWVAIGSRPDGQLGQDGHLDVAEDGHRHGSRDRRGRHDEDVRPGSVQRLRGERGPLLDAEPVLLVDDDEPEVAEGDGVLQQGVGADDDARIARDDVEQLPATGRDPLRSGDQGHPGGCLSCAESPRLGQRTEHGRDRPVVLCRQHLRRRQQGRLPAGVHHPEHGAKRDHGLAAADVALQQSVHRMVALHVGIDLGTHLALAGGQVEGQARIEGVTDGRALGDAAPGRQRCRLGTTLGEQRLQDVGLLEPQPRHRRLDVVLARRPMDRPQRVAQRRSADAPRAGRRAAGPGSSCTWSSTTSTALRTCHEATALLAG